MVPDTKVIGETVLTLCFGIAGAFCFWLVGLPAAFITGPAVCVTLAALLGLPVRIPDQFRMFCLAVIGTGIGAGITPEVMGTALHWPLSFLVLAFVQWASILIGAVVLLRLLKFDLDDAVICAIPGLLSFTISLAMDRGADTARVSLVQSVRVFILALFVPLFLMLAGIDVSHASRTFAPGMKLYILVPLLAIVWLVGRALERKSLPAAFVMVGVILGATASLTGIAEGGMPRNVSIVAFVLIGSLIGSRFRGRHLRDMGKDAFAGVVVTTSAATIALAGAWGVSGLLGIPLASVLIAFAPGGLEVMIALAVQMKVDPTFVAAHHIVRLLFLMALVPIVIRQLDGKRRRLQ